MNIKFDTTDMPIPTKIPRLKLRHYKKCLFVINQIRHGKRQAAVAKMLKVSSTRVHQLYSKGLRLVQEKREYFQHLHPLTFEECYFKARIEDADRTSDNIYAAICKRERNSDV